MKHSVYSSWYCLLFQGWKKDRRRKKNPKTQSEINPGVCSQKWLHVATERKRNQENTAVFLSAWIPATPFYLTLTANVRQTQIVCTTEAEISTFVLLLCLFVSEADVAAGKKKKTLAFQENKRCLRGNISEVLCWWLSVWQTGGRKSSTVFILRGGTRAEEPADVFMTEEK